jgi:hypothetical protein
MPSPSEIVGLRVVQGPMTALLRLRLGTPL